MNTSTSITNLAGALLRFDSEPFQKGRTNDFTNSKYADLDTILSAVHGPLRAAGLVVVQFPTTCASGEPGLLTRLVHAESGEWIEDVVPFVGLQTVNKNAAQALGSYVTYVRRYALRSVLQLPGEKDDDDDGNAAGGSEPKKGVKAPAAAPDRPAGWRGALSECKSEDDIKRLFRGCSAGMDKESDEYAQLVNDCADRKAELS